VFLHSITAFGGPTGHYGMMLKTFVQQRKDVTEEELLDFYSFTSLLPGAGSTQMLTLIGYKRGGLLLATLTLLIWIIPACLLMSLFSFVVRNYQTQAIDKWFIWVQPMAIGFLIFAAVQMFKLAIKNTITWVIMLVSAVLTFIWFKSPWVFPVLLIAGGMVTNFSDKRIPQVANKPKKIAWYNITVFALLFLVAGICSELARSNNWPHRKAFNLFENTYRHGSLVFGGGNVLIPYLMEQYTVRPDYKISDEKMIRIEKDELLTGAGLVRCIPGPVFSIAAYTGGLALKDGSVSQQILGCIIGSVAIFLPTALLVFFFFPVWINLKKFAVVYRAIEGINAVVMGILIASIIAIANFSGLLHSGKESIINLLVIVATFALLQFTKLPSALVAVGVILLGLVYGFLL
jgi:chromate transporter